LIEVDAMHDVVIIGAVPAGCRTARLCEEAGLDVLVLERKPEIGVPVQCSGLISSNLDRFIRVPKRIVENRVSKAVVHGPGKDIELMKPGTAAYVIDREGLDRLLASQVSSPIRTGHEARSLSIGSSVSIRTDHGEFRARALVGADGPGSVVRKHFGARPVETVQGIFAMVDEEDSSDTVELWLDRKSCDGFLWRIPRGSRVEYGMLGSSVKFPALERFFKLGKYTRGAGIIPMGGCKSFFDRTLLVGDSAAQTKPWSGGGVIYGLTAAGHAAKTLSGALAENDLSEKRLSSYEDAWKAELWNPICTGMMARELYKDMSDEQFRKVFAELAGQDLNSLDMDFPVFGF
jgi:digeranylgeranylglycerophospholipid reductase